MIDKPRWRLRKQTGTAQTTRDRFIFFRVGGVGGQARISSPWGRDYSDSDDSGAGLRDRLWIKREFPRSPKHLSSVHQDVQLWQTGPGAGRSGNCWIRNRQGSAGQRWDIRPWGSRKTKFRPKSGGTFGPSPEEAFIYVFIYLKSRFKFFKNI